MARLCQVNRLGVAYALSPVLITLCALIGVFGYTHHDSLIPTQWDALGLRYIARAFLQGIDPYSQDSMSTLATETWLPVQELFYPPSFMPLLASCALLPETVFRVLIVVLQIVSFVYISQRSCVRTSSAHTRALLAPLLMFSVYQTARFGQVSCFSVALLLLFWDRYRTGTAPWIQIVLLTLASVKPSVSIAVLVFLIFERRCTLLVGVAAAHLVLTCIAAALTGIEPFSLVRGWLAVLPRYRECLVNIPAGGYIYGLSTLLYQASGVFFSLEWLSLPIVYWIWRTQQRYSRESLIALLLVVSFLVSTPHAYEFCMILPALVCVSRVGDAVGWCWVVTVMSMFPQRLLQTVAPAGFDSTLRALGPLVLCVILSRIRDKAVVAEEISASGQRVFSGSSQDLVRPDSTQGRVFGL